jgi:ABC-type multidrug transport system fused ATPase/permease subunit
MRFLPRLLADYASAYRIAVAHYRAFPYQLPFATAFVALIAGLDALIPFFLREAANRVSSNDPTVAAYAIVPTIIVITHRDALWKAADRIYEVGSGCVRELGAIDAEQPFLQG